MHGLLVSAASTYGFTGGHYWHVMLSDIREALGEHGIGTDFTDQSVREPYMSAISAIWHDTARHPDFVMTMNMVENFDLVVNNAINLDASLLMRAYYAMSQGCIVATEANAFVRENFADGRNMIVLGESEADRERLWGLLASPNQLHDLSLAAHAAQQADHCWVNRIPSLTQALKP